MIGESGFLYRRWGLTELVVGAAAHLIDGAHRFLERCQQLLLAPVRLQARRRVMADAVHEIVPGPAKRKQ